MHDFNVCQYMTYKINARTEVITYELVNVYPVHKKKHEKCSFQLL